MNSGLLVRNQKPLLSKVLNVITQEELQKAGGRDITQLITEKTGVYINGFNSNIGKDKSVYVRGANPAFTLITIDGIPVYDASGIGGNFDLSLYMF